MNTFIKGQCHTNLDGYDCSEVIIFARVPNIGERVYCRRKGQLTSLRVVQITHDIRGTFGNEYPYIHVELHN